MRQRQPCLRSRALAIFCIALTLVLCGNVILSAHESLHHEVEIAQAKSSKPLVYCVVSGQTCGVADHDSDDFIPHLHVAGVGFIALPALASPETVHRQVAFSFVLPPCLLLEGRKQQTPERPPRTICI